jgi:hypothetical protein
MLLVTEMSRFCGISPARARAPGLGAVKFSDWSEKLGVVIIVFIVCFDWRILPLPEINR